MSNHTNPFGIAQINIDDWDFLGLIYIGGSEEIMSDYTYDMDETFNAIARVRNIDLDHDHDHGLITFHANGGCAACGTFFAHGAVVHNSKTDDIIAIGGICAGTWGLAKQIGMRAARARKAAANAEIKAAAHGAAQSFLTENEGLEDAFETDHYIVKDIERKLWQYGDLSDKQVELVFKIAREQVERLVAQAARKAHLDAAPALAEGRYTIEGRIVSTKTQESIYGTQYKMLVEMEDGNRVWGTVPSIIWDVEAGSRVKFDAAVERSKDDEHFGFYKRPTKAIMTHHADGRVNEEDAA
jgi:hypothetical protein